MVKPAPRWGLVLDMDDTLYLERDYVRSGFRAVARHLAGGSTDMADAYEDFLWERFESGERGDHFNVLLERYPSERLPPLTVGELVAIYREHVPTIHLAPGMADVLEQWRRQGHTLSLVSDGALASQRAKVQALQLEEWFEGPIVLTDTWGRSFWKPHHRAFEYVRDHLGLPADRMVYIADNPHKDFVAPRALEWRTIRLRLPGQLHAEAPDVIDPDITVDNIAALGPAIDSLSDTRHMG